MSETTETTPEVVQPTLEPPEVVQPTETTEQAQQPTETTPEPPKKPPQSDRRFAQMTRRIQETEAREAEATRRAEAAEALLNAGKPPAETPPPNQRTVEQEALRLIAERDYNQRRSAVIAKGEQEFGRDGWLEKTTILGDLGATNNAAFMSALLEQNNAPKIVSALAEDVDGLVELLNKSPTAMAAALGRMDAKMEQPAASVKAPTSNAPRPASPLQPAAVLPEIDPFGENQDKLTMAEWNAAFEKSDTGKRLLRRRA